jgi:DNA-binding Lrp family transcriptional regulator
MDAPYSLLEFSLLNDWQRDFPLTSRPFATLGSKVGAGETAVLSHLQRLNQRGAISRIGAVFAPRRAGAGTLAALAAPPGKLDDIAALVSARAEVNHNYQREHHWNLWFVVTARNHAALNQTLAAIEADTGCAVISLPLRQEFHIDLGFDLRRPSRGHRARSPAEEMPQRPLTDVEFSLLAALEPGLPLCAEPYAQLGDKVGMTEAEVMRHIHGWQQEGLIKRFGIVVRHHEMGYRANAMVVFDVADAEVAAVGEKLAREPAVTLCYRRERALPHWPYNLYCMVHGRQRAEVAPVVDRLAATAGVTPNILFSVRRYKQCGARYFS